MEVIMTSINRRIPPKRDAAEHAATASDKTGRLEVKFINHYKGRGVFATTPFKKGDFVVEYRGELINYEESQRRRRLYHSACAVFMFDFLWQERWWCIDASREDNSLGRLVNDDHKNPSCTMKKILVDGKPHLCLFAVKDINPGEEITYNYGGTDWPWREKASKESSVTEAVEVEHAGSSDQAPSKSSKKKASKESSVTEAVEVEHAGSSDQAPSKSSKKKASKESSVTEAVEVEHAGSSGSSSVQVLREK
ncbi:N-lysine methyltransferase KMT5A-A-like, partial [Fundulus heteroclitus]|uniref:N-lysine methyltransferase KMT5A-A-like n=1 Tax=Fundulus heteroclitus TaxID=8078 RepID=UPI00165CADFB